MAPLPPYPGAPRWVKVSGIAIGGLVLLLAIIVLIGAGGPHGPARHAPPGGQAGGHAGWGLLTILGVTLAVGVALSRGRLLDRYVSRVRRSPRSPIMPPRLRKLVLLVHVATSVGSLGAVAVFLAFAVAGLVSQDAQLVRAAYIADGLIAWYIILPLILVALIIGILQSLGSPWGLLRHYWVLAKLVLTIATLYILLLQLDGISAIAGIAADTAVADADLLGLRRSMRMHAAGGLVVLLLLVGLSVYKPRGLTRYGWLRQYRPPEAASWSAQERSRNVPLDVGDEPHGAAAAGSLQASRPRDTESLS
ncbi:hypothetical protein [Inquilinus sp. Marseille-Q2685]|uniref:hypothetical protein n=1 Tax=Inquilinus sp. Marseille-Q2685 TaxID=2866581 RepID=UPI001CE3CBD4|nr:hypothetical protein [Inquilinus sp. Marseille-Q2685]